MSHPLTDDIIADIAHGGYIDDYCQYHYVEDDLRTAADWQLEQVIEWIKENLYYIQEDGLVRYVYGDGFATIASDEVITDLKKAMRPTTKQEDN
jgi:hypothetical protein